MKNPEPVPLPILHDKITNVTPLYLLKLVLVVAFASIFGIYLGLFIADMFGIFARDVRAFYALCGLVFCGFLTPWFFRMASIGPEPKIPKKVDPVN